MTMTTQPVTGGRYLRDPDTGALTPAAATATDETPARDEAAEPEARPAKAKKGT